MVETLVNGDDGDGSIINGVIGILSGYIGRYVKDDSFRKTIREKCISFLDRIRKRRRKDADDDDADDDEIFVNIDFCMEKIDKLIEVYHQGTKKQVTMMKSLRNSIELLTKIASKSHLSSCAQLYLAIAYKLMKNDKVSSKFLLQVFCYSPNLARTYLLCDLWEHLFLPHLLHLKIWYTSEFEFLSNEVYGEKEKKIKVLNKVYNEKMDSGTYLFAMYYKQWLKVSGAGEPPLPIVPLPSRPSYRSSRRMSSDSTISNSSINPNLYKAVFGLKEEKQKPTCLGDKSGIMTLSKKLEIDKKFQGDDYKCSSVQKQDRFSFERSSSQIDKNQAQRLDYFKCLSCRFIPTETMSKINYIKSKNASLSVLSSDLVEAIRTICSSDILTECEFAIRVVTKAWLNSPGDPLIEEALTQTSVVEVQCSPQVAAFYILDQLLNGFDEDKNLENARQVLSLGGLTLLMKRIEDGEMNERENSALIISCCVRAEGSCRSYLAENINKSSLLELIVLGWKQNSSGNALFVISELLSLDRRTKILKFLRGLNDGWSGLNTMHIFFTYLQKAPQEERPLVAVILLMLDLM
ncbi:E3 ubiquitin-protein ligase LIN-like protein, partial [Trifolium pratense]